MYSYDNRSAGRSQQEIDKVLRDMLAELKSGPVPKEIEHLANKLQDLLDQKMDEAARR